MRLTAIQSAVRPGQRYWVTNHYFTDPEQPAFGMTLRTVETASSRGILLTPPAAAGDITVRRTPWPKASLIDMTPDGTILIRADGKGRQREGDLFLTLAPVPPGAELPLGHQLTIAQFTGITSTVTLDKIEEFMRGEQPLLDGLTRTEFAELTATCVAYLFHGEDRFTTEDH